MSNPTLSDLLDVDDEEVSELIDEAYGLSKKQGVLYELMDEMSEQLENLKQLEEENVCGVETVRKENARFRNATKKKFK